MSSFPALPTELLDEVEWTAPSGVNFRFTNVAPNEWTIHRAYTEGYEAHLRRSGSFYDFSLDAGTVQISEFSVSLGEVLAILN